MTPPAIAKAIAVLEQWECRSCSGTGQKSHLTEVGTHKVTCAVCRGNKLDPRAAAALADLKQWAETQESATVASNRGKAVDATAGEGVVAVTSAEIPSTPSEAGTAAPSAALQHDWVPSQLGHGETMCTRCFITNREAAALGQLDRCSVTAPDASADRRPEEPQEGTYTPEIMAWAEGVHAMNPDSASGPDAVARAQEIVDQCMGERHSHRINLVASALAAAEKRGEEREREACAKMLDERKYMTGDFAAAEIRARSQPDDQQAIK